ncbi:MAG: hypothetical protein Q4C46_06090 [Bacillota bacterium]|nr:hypothetical protein [Bacillota bacterium]
MKCIHKRIKICLTVFLIVSAAVCISVYAGKVYEISFINGFRTGSTDIKIGLYEEADDGYRHLRPGKVMPNSRVSCIPIVTNLRADGYVRVKVEIVMNKDVPHPVSVENIYGIKDGWIIKGDCFYKIAKMKSGETSEIFKGFHIPEEWSEETSEGFSVKLTADVIQDQSFIPDFDSAAPWGNVEIETAKEKDNIVYGNAKRTEDTHVIQYSQSGGLHKETTDLFRNFNHFMAGHKYKDSLTIENSSKKRIKVYFRTEAADNTLPDKMQLRILCGGKNVYEGNLVSHEFGEYKEIAEMGGGEKQLLEFEVELPKESVNYYSVLDDKVVWNFKVQELQNEADVRTWDDSNIYAAISVCAASAALIPALIYGARRRKKCGNSK